MLDFLFTTFRKRDHRVREAEQRAESAYLELAATAWDVRTRLRAALAETVLARREAELPLAEERIHLGLCG